MNITADKDALRNSTARCSICQKDYTGRGHNARPVNHGRCCDSCNARVVLPARAERAKATRDE